MNCHGKHENSTNSNGKGHKGHLSHMLMMALCCGAPVIILLLVPLIGKIGGPGVSKAISGIAPFLCPLIMIPMMWMMFKGNKNKGGESDCNQNRQLMPGDETQEQ